VAESGVILKKRNIKRKREKHVEKKEKQKEDANQERKKYCTNIWWMHFIKNNFRYINLKLFSFGREKYEIKDN
jgi:hypothetical protein